MKIRLAAVVCGLAIAGVSTGVVVNAQSEEARAQNSTRVAAPAAQEEQVAKFDTSGHRGYKKIGDLAPETEAAVTFTAGSATVETIAGLPFTVTSATVTDSLDGIIPAGTVIKVRQTGQTEKLEPSNGPQLLEDGKSYAAALMKFHFEPTDETGQWVVVGDGLWKDEGNGKLALDASESALPAATTVTTLEGALGGG